MEIKGQIEDIIYQNEMNSYTVALLNIEDVPITIVGYLPFVNQGDTLKLIGDFVVHQEYGKQFKVETFEKIMPETLESLEKYLINGTIKGVGPITARKIIEKFGEQTIYTIRYEPKKLAVIKGITEEKAELISQSFIENLELWQLVGFLEKFSIGIQNARNVYKKLGGNAIEIIEDNPYILLDVANNVDFKIIDNVAIKMGIDLNNIIRVKSAIKYALIRTLTNGNTIALKENVKKYVSDLLNVSGEIIEEALTELKTNEEIKSEKIEEKEWLSYYSVYKAEVNIAEKIINLINSRNLKYIPNIEKEIEKIEKKIDIELSEKQKDAIRIINNNNVVIITGGPGTGKTTIIKSILDLYKGKNKKCVLCAPTGRAAKRMTETTGEEAKTLHRLLEIGKYESDNIINISYEVSPIDADVIIVDEMSMVDLFLMNYLIKGIYPGTKLILVGDIDQLPSVGPGSVLKDFINSNCIETIVLNKIFRQAAKSKIVVNSHRVNEGLMFISKDEGEDLNEDFFFIDENNEEKILKEVISLKKDRLKKYCLETNNIQVITPSKKGPLGTKELNKYLQEIINPKLNRVEKRIGENVYRENDRVMQIKNNYDIFWEKGSETGTGIFNGELGVIETISNDDKFVKIKFDDGKIATYEFSELDQIEHAYAITIHKAQGSEFDIVIIPITHAAPMLLTRNLLYTGMTRTKKMLIIIGNKKIVEFMINNIDIKKRNTGLENKIKIINGTEI